MCPKVHLSFLFVNLFVYNNEDRNFLFFFG